MVFEEFLKKNVVVEQLIGYPKHGFVEKIEEGFLFLRFEDGRLDSILIKNIRGICEKVV
jgi:hypothetical protein